MKSSYSLVGHTLLPLIYKVPVNGCITYFIKEPRTQQLLMLNPQPKSALEQHIANIQQLAQAKHKAILINSAERSKAAADTFGAIQTFSIGKGANDIRPFTIGELAICLLHMPGPAEDNACISVTHVAEGSTKLPVLFVASLLGVCCIGQSTDDRKYTASLEKLKYFPNEAFIFPEQAANLTDLQFAASLDPINEVVKMKMSIFGSTDQPDKLLPTTLIEQKGANPFLNPAKFKDILGSADRLKCFSLLRQLRKKFDTQA